MYRMTRQDESESEEGETTPASQMFRPFAAKTIPGAPRKGGDRSVRRLKPSPSAIDDAIKDIIALTRKEVELAENNATQKQDNVVEAMKKEKKAKLEGDEASKRARKAAEEATHANNNALSIN